MLNIEQLINFDSDSEKTKLPLNQSIADRSALQQAQDAILEERNTEEVPEEEVKEGIKKRDIYLDSSAKEQDVVLEHEPMLI